ncbi:response regulator transcription factor [Nocardioides albidus]|uniref:Response regulator transcription factor n=1 Tax=Nocardioides albidus TaxID=1517589 RepID=A0A5C4W124_9ACTN|nr:response regulator transcription factor [Nocardioides albidus]TNM41236.1 response regulator transcription factor [Nocardioides albidus]
MISVVLADDHVVVREGLKALLTSVEGIDVIGLASDGREAVRAAVTQRPDVLVLDVAMPGLDGVGAAREIARVAPDVAILMLTMHEDDDTVREAMQAGARGYLLKGADQRQVVRAIESVAAGEAVFGSAIAPQVLEAVARRGPAAAEPFPGLSGREREVLALLASGMPSRAIADRLGLAVKTVNNHLSAVFAKLGVSGRTEAALMARRVGLGDEPLP